MAVSEPESKSGPGSSRSVDGRPDVLIIGAGVIGCAIATELGRRGHRTLNLDRGSTAGGGSTSSSSAIIRFSYSTATGVNFSWEGLHYWKNWEAHIGVTDELGLARYNRCGQLLMAQHDGDFTSVVRRLWEELDIPFEALTRSDLGERLPWLDPGLYGPPSKPDDDAFWKEATGSLQGAIYSPDAGYVSDPQLAAHNLQRAAEAAGGIFRFGADVASVDRDGQRVTGVTLANGETIQAPVVVNVAGPHSSVINKMVGVYESMAIKTGPMRQEVHHLPAPDGVDLMTSAAVMADEDMGYYCRPDVGNNLLVGSLEPECDELEWLDDPDDYDVEISERLWTTQSLRVSRRIPSLGVPHKRRGIVGVYDVSDDWLPVYDRTDLAGFYVAMGTSGNQFKNAGATGGVMADIIEAVEGGHDQDADPLVLTGRYTGRPIETASFSRNRAVSTESSMSVMG